MPSMWNNCNKSSIHPYSTDCILSQMPLQIQPGLLCQCAIGLNQNIPVNESGNFHGISRCRQTNELHPSPTESDPQHPALAFLPGSRNENCPELWCVGRLIARCRIHVNLHLEQAAVTGTPGHVRPLHRNRRLRRFNISSSLSGLVLHCTIDVCEETDLNLEEPGQLLGDVEPSVNNGDKVDDSDCRVSVKELGCRKLARCLSLARKSAIFSIENDP
ncbi:hypothetical protein NPIL_72191 [Nephila pilipes]|uniref:Uncharacterized protein n=1 Tax=Nephila pilipes TaxID=299642 RepID=A0A8X6TIU1_NEPPI|nr:hypothetical protein NPIL_72191 [Nephila pilipes]